MSPDGRHDRTRTLESAVGPESGRYPAGAVGLIAAHPGQVPLLLEEMLQHYTHYRQTAWDFSHAWIQQHDPRRTLAVLVGADAARRQIHVA